MKHYKAKTLCEFQMRADPLGREGRCVADIVPIYECDVCEIDNALNKLGFVIANEDSLGISYKSKKWPKTCIRTDGPRVAPDRVPLILRQENLFESDILKASHQLYNLDQKIRGALRKRAWFS